MGHKLEETLAATMFNKEKLQALTNNCKKNDHYLMGFGMGF